MKRSPDGEILTRMRQAFLQHGFEALSMIELARAAGMSRRALYYHYPNKDALYRALIRWGNDQAMAKGLQAGRVVREAGGSPTDILSEILDVRYGDTRRIVEVSPHTLELNAVTFLKCHDILVDAAAMFQQDLAALVTSLVEEDVMRLRPDFSAADVAQTLANGARGVNQALPPAPPETLKRRYRQMCEAVLFGAAVRIPDAPRRSKPESGDEPE